MIEGRAVGRDSLACQRQRTKDAATLAHDHRPYWAAHVRGFQGANAVRQAVGVDAFRAGVVEQCPCGVFHRYGLGWVLNWDVRVDRTEPALLL